MVIAIKGWLTCIDVLIDPTSLPLNKDAALASKVLRN